MMKIAMIGQKGVPATYGGVERHVEELGSRLVKLGHEVTVFTRPNYTDPHLREHRGMRLVCVPTIGTKHLDAIVSSAIASFACWFGGYDLVHYHSIGPCLVSPIVLVRGRHVVATIHGQDWLRGKWGRPASRVLRLGEWMALRVPHVTISVSKTLADAYYAATGHPVEYIPNGITIDARDDTSVLDEFNLEEGRYILFVGRLVPEKGAHHLIRAHAQLESAPKLVLAGDSTKSDKYAAGLRKGGGKNVVFAGYQYGGRLASLFRHAALFVLPSDLEGLPIVLLEALAYGAPVLASDIPPNVEILGTSGFYFRAGDVADLARALNDCLGSLESVLDRTLPIRLRTLADYDWDRIAQRTEDAYKRATRVSRRTPPFFGQQS